MVSIEEKSMRRERWDEYFTTKDYALLEASLHRYGAEICSDCGRLIAEGHSYYGEDCRTKAVCPECHERRYPTDEGKEEFRLRMLDDPEFYSLAETPTEPRISKALWKEIFGKVERLRKDGIEIDWRK